MNSAASITEAMARAVRDRTCLRVATSESKLGNSLGCIHVRDSAGGGLAWRRQGSHALVLDTQPTKVKASKQSRRHTRRSNINLHGNRCGTRRRDGIDTDRKSTRLNSSHANIS